MKTVLIILCAFLLQAEVEAQTWRKISPEKVGFDTFDGIRDSSGRLHLFGTSHGTLYHSVDGISWDMHTGEQVGIRIGIGHNYPDQKVYSQFTGVIKINNNQVLFPLSMGSNNLPDYSKFHPKYLKSNLASAQTLNVQPFYKDSISIFDPQQLEYSELNKLFYVLRDTTLKYFENEESEIFSQKSPLTSTVLYIGIHPYKKSTLYASTTSIIKSVNGGEWEEVYKWGQQDNSDLLLREIVYPPKDENSLLLITYDLGNTGSKPKVLRYDENIKKMYEVLTASVYKLIFKKNSDIGLAFVAYPANYIYRTIDAGRTWIKKDISFPIVKNPYRNSPFIFQSGDNFYIGTENGEVYQSEDGETWINIASGFTTSPVSGLYIAGKDSLIVGTEDGIWINYTLPVSVTEEIPFKNNELTITPNPANSSLKISFLKTDVPQQLSVYNSLGQLVFTTEFSGEFVWDFKNDIPDGMYTVTVQAGEKSVSKQVVILH